ncbi:ATP-dependent helicase C-terminal domain-containing protein [Kallotenue papyrolyticum]|uniref:ATP-dependent helicase C-terminal domain-containing protein n=1 Tax=Kallotenue papyrolyticum TaxID=1325125 RepID=UPI003B83236F
MPLTLHLLSPADCPRDARPRRVLARRLFRDVRRELRGRYPKHAWPAARRGGHV